MQFLTLKWVDRFSGLRVVLGMAGSGLVLVLLWRSVLQPLEWPDLKLVGKYFGESATSIDTYKALLMTGFRAVVAMAIGFSLAILLSVLTGRTILGWLLFFFLLLSAQKIPAIAMVHVLVRSKLGIGFLMTISLASTVVLTFTWLILHHRARTLDSKEVFALRVVGFRRWERTVFGLLPHMGSAIGGAARLAMSISIIMVVLGEWQGLWSDGTIWQFGLGVQISRSYEAIHSEARVLAACIWLGILGIVLDAMVLGGLLLGRRLTGVDFRR